MIEFDCEGCGVHVIDAGRDVIPNNHQCSTCEWLCEHLFGEDFWEAYLRMNPEAKHCVQ
jgi:hypothetical protein